MSSENSVVAFSSELSSAIEKLIATSKPLGTVTEDEIQVALADVDVDADELNVIYDQVRGAGIEITTAGSAEISEEDDAPQSTDKCDGCGECADVCPMNAIDIVGGKISVLTTHCVACALCSDICPLDAIEFIEVDGNRLIVDDPETKKKVEEDERQRQKEAENREKAKKYGQKMIDMLEKEADEAEARGEKL